MKGVTIVIRIVVGGYHYFNPHTREGCDPEAAGEVGDEEISIHTPVKGVTAEGDDGDLDHDISIHTPVKGVTCGRR